MRWNVYPIEMPLLSIENVIISIVMHVKLHYLETFNLASIMGLDVTYSEVSPKVDQYAS